MRKVAFIAHDPGGCEAMYPVFKKMEREAIFLALGPSAIKFADNAVTKEECEKILQGMFDNGDLAGVVLGRDWGTELDVQVLSWARQHKVKSIVILDYWSNYAASFRVAGKEYWPDAYFVMDELARQEAIADGVPDDILKIVGQPALDKFCNMADNDVPDKDVLFLSQPLSLLYGERLGYTEWSVLAEVAKACQRCGRRLEVKFHSKDDPAFQQRYSDIAVCGDVDALMRHYKLVIGMSTMALLHAALMQVPIVSYQPGLKVVDGCITNKLGLSMDVRSYNDLLIVMSGRRYRETGKRVKKRVRAIWMDGCSAFRATEAVKEVFEV